MNYNKVVPLCTPEESSKRSHSPNNKSNSASVELTSKTTNPSVEANTALNNESATDYSIDKNGNSSGNDKKVPAYSLDKGSNSLSKRENRPQLIRSMTNIFVERVNRMHSAAAVDPASHFWQWWSIVLIMMWMYTVCVVPMEVPFNDVVELMFWPDLCVDLFFLADMIILFYVGYYDNNQGRVIMDIKAIKSAYLKSWFIVDVLSVVPFSALYLATNFESQALYYLRFLKFARFARVQRVLSIIHKSEPLNSLWDALQLSYAVKALAGQFLRLVLLCHLLACVWCLAAEPQEQALERNSWITVYGIRNEGWSTVYLSALYWSMMTFTTIGYGDVVPVNNIERGVSIVSMILAATYYAYLVGAISTVFNTSNQATHDFQTLMDNLNKWVNEYNCDTALRRKLRRFFNLSQPLLKDKYYDDVLTKMSPGLRGEFCAHLYQESLAKVDFLQPPKSVSTDRKTQFLGVLAQKLVPKAYPAGEQLIRIGDGTSDPTSLMYIVRRGLLGAGGKVMRVGGVVGEDIICRNHKRWYRVTCLTFVDSLTLSHSALFETLESSSDLREQLLKVRRAANSHALRTTILEIVRRVKMLKTFLRSTEAVNAGMGSPRTGSYKRITVRLDTDQYFDKNGDIFDPQKKIEELKKLQQKNSTHMHAVDALQWGSKVRRRSTAELVQQSDDHAVLMISDSVNKQDNIYDVLSKLDLINVNSMSCVEALTFLDSWRQELLCIDKSFEVTSVGETSAEMLMAGHIPLTPNNKHNNNNSEDDDTNDDNDNIDIEATDDLDALIDQESQLTTTL